MSISGWAVAPIGITSSLSITIFWKDTEAVEELLILIEADSDELKPDDYNFLVHLHKIIQTTQPGKYEFGNFKFDIKELKETTKTRIKNPKFDKKLLEIH